MSGNEGGAAPGGTTLVAPEAGAGGQPAAPAAPGAGAAAPAAPAAPAAGGAAPAAGAPPATPKPGAAGTTLEPAATADIAIKTPEGYTAGKTLESFKGIAKELGLKSEGAQKLFDLYVNSHNEAVAAQATELDKQHKGWLEAQKADKEFGGADWDKNAQLARKAVLKFASPELRTWLRETGLGDHPELVRAFVRIGKAIGEDGIEGTAGGGAGAASASDRLRRMYPNSPGMFSKE